MKALTAACGLIFIALLAGCAGSAKRLDSVTSQSAVPTNAKLPVRDVGVRVADANKKDVGENVKFDMLALKGMIERTLAPADLNIKDAPYTLDVEVTSVYVRGTFNAVMFGFMSGRDNVTGIVRVLDAKGAPVRSFEVSASYALGGFAGGQDGMRMNYLYEKFAELTRDNLSGSQ